MTALVPRVQARLALPAHRRVRSLLEGGYAAVHTGRGTELADLRPYVRGDDPHDLEPKASARSGELLVKRYVADRRHTVLLVVAGGREMAAHHAGGGTKRDLAAQVAGTVGWLAVRHGDLVAAAHQEGPAAGPGPTTGQAPGHRVVRPASGAAHLERCLQAAHAAAVPGSPPGDLLGLLHQVRRTVRRRTLMLLVCEDQSAPDGLVELLRRLTAQHEVMVATVGDLDPTDPALAARPTRDLDGTVLPAWLRHDPLLHDEHGAAVAQRRRTLADAVSAAGAVHEHVSDEPDVLRAVLRLLERHRRARRR